MWKIPKTKGMRDKESSEIRQKEERRAGGKGMQCEKTCEKIRGSGFDRLKDREFLVSKKSGVGFKLVQE